MDNVKKNDWIAINLNAPENISIENLYDYGITPDNTGIQSEDYYKSIKQVQNTKAFQNDDGSFSNEKFHVFYESALRSYNQYQNINYTQTLLDSIETSPYDVFALGDGRRVMDTSAIISRSGDPNRTTHGLGNLFETGKPVFDVREVAQANKMRDENGNVLDWSPNDRGGLLKGIFRPSAALAQYDENGTHFENGVEVPHKKGDLKLDENGDPYYELLKGKELYGRETLRYWDTITDDDGIWNKLDFMDSDGLHKSIGGTIARTATTLGLYFIPGVGEYLGWIGAAMALSKTLPVLAKGINGIIGSNDGEFGQAMTMIENWADRFGYSQSRDVQGKFWSFENIGDIIASSAGQLFQQRLIGQIPKKFAKAGNMLQASKIGRGMSLGYMASTSATDTYSIFKEAGADDATAGVATLAVTAALFGLMNINYFKDWLFVNSWLDEDYALRNTIKTLIDENTLESFKIYQETMKKSMPEMARRMERIKLFKTIHDKTQTAVKKLAKKANATIRPTEHQIDAAIKLEGEKAGITPGMRASIYLSRMFNEGFEETLEEVGSDLAKGVTLGLNALGINVTEDGKTLDFGLTGRDILSRYTSAFIGGAIGGAVFEGINHWEGGTYDSLMEKSLAERLLWYERNGYGKEVRDRVDRLYRKGKLGNINLSASPKKLQNLEGKDIIVYGQGNESDNQNLFVYNQINAYLDRLDAAIAREDLYSDNKIFSSIFEKLQEKHGDDDENLEVKLYHFLEDIDTAKALTLQEIGFLSVVKKDADKLSYDILDLDTQIETQKNKIRKDNKIGDANSSREDELFKNNLYLKDLQERLKEKRTAFKEIAEGKRNGYYMGLAHIKTNQVYRSMYYDSSAENWENLQEGFATIGVENYCLNTRGINYNDITDADLKQRIDEEYAAMQNLNDEDFDRKMYDYHLKFATKFNPDIEAANNALHRKTYIFAPDLFVQQAKEFANEIDDPIIKGAALRLETELKGIADDTSDKARIKRAELIRTSLDEMFPSVKGYSREKDMLRFLSKLNDAVTSGTAYSDVSLFQSMILGELVRSAKTKMENDAKIKNGIEDQLNELAARFHEQANASEEEQKKFLDTLTEEELEKYNLSEYKDELSKPITERDDYVVGNAPDSIREAISDKFPLLGNATERRTLADKIGNLYSAIRNNAPNTSDAYNDLINFFKINTGLSESEAKEIIDRNLFPETNLAEYVIQEQAKTDPSEQLITEMLNKFQIYAGVNLFNAMRLLQDKEMLKARMEKKDEFGLTESEERQLEMTISALRVISAVVTGSADGLNEELNVSGDNFAVTPEELIGIYDYQIRSVLARINNLLNLSRRNKMRTSRAQQETFIEITKKRVESLTGIGEIDFDGDKLNFVEMFSSGISIVDATLANAKSWSSAYAAFENALSTRLREIFVKYKQNGNVDRFVEILVNKFGNEVYSQDPGVIDNKETTKITPYGNVTYLITRTILNSAKFSSVWKTATEEEQELIPIYSQEYCVYENVASIIDSHEKLGLFDALNKMLLKWPDSKATKEKSYFNDRQSAKRFSNTDGVGGVGKTAGVGYFTDKIIKKLYKNVSSTAASVTREASENLHEALHLGENNKPAITFSEILDRISKKQGPNGKVTILFEFDSLFNGKNDHYKPREDKLKEALSKIDKKVINELFNSSDGLRILHFDETGLLDVRQAIFLMELANKFDFFISGYGDSLQNKAKNGTGIEDIVHHRTPSLTISMRAQCSGITENTQLLQETLRETRNLFFEDPSTPPSLFDDKVGKVLDEKKTNGIIQLAYDSQTYSGAWIVEPNDDVLEIAKKMINFVRQSNEADKDIIRDNSKKKHKIAIVADADNKANSYRNQLASDSDVVEIVSPENVQGREFDFVIVDKNFDSNKYLALTDFYTMVTRAKIGACVINNGNVIEDMGFRNNDKPAAAEATFGSTPEQKLAIYQDYITWRRGLMEDVPDYTEDAPTSTNSTASSSNASQQGTQSQPDGQNSPAETEFAETLVTVIPGLSEEEQNELETNPEKRIEYYVQRVLDGEVGSEWDSKQLRERRNKLEKGRAQYVDADEFVSILKDFTNDLEDLPMTIPGVESIATEDGKKAYRTFVSIVSRALLNCNTAKDRRVFIVSAQKLLERLTNQFDSEQAVITSLEESFDENGNEKDGFFVVKEGYIYYSFNHNDEQCLIPISLNKELNDGAYSDINFDLAVPSIKISTGGEIMLPFDDVLNEIDGLVTDKNGDVYIGIVYPDDAIRTTTDGDEDALKYLNGNSGKSMVAVRTGANTFEFGDNFFAVQKDKNGRIISANKQIYKNSERQGTSEIGVQEIITLSDWLRAVRNLRSIVHTGDYYSDADKAFTDDFFYGKNLLSDIGAPTNLAARQQESDKVTSERYKKLSDYRVLTRDSVNGLTSALLRYCAKEENKDSKFAKNFLQNFIKWIGTKPSNDDTRTHRKGIAIRFKTEDEFGTRKTHLYYILPDIKEDGGTDSYTILKFGLGWEEVGYGTGTLGSLLGGIDNLNIVDFIEKSLNSVTNEDEATLLSEPLSNLEENLQNGSIVAFPVDAYTTNDTETIIGTFSAFETDVYSWMLDENNSAAYIPVDELTEFLRTDYIFKNNLYREIQGEHEGVPEGNGYMRGKNINSTKLSVDICKMIHPLYQVHGTALMQNSDERLKTVSDLLQNSTNLESDIPGFYFDIGKVDYKEDGSVITFFSMESWSAIIGPQVNAAWLQRYGNAPDTMSGVFFIRTFDYEKGSITIEQNGSNEVIQLNSDGIKAMFDNVPKLKDAINFNSISDITGKYKVILGAISKLIINSNIGEQEYENPRLIGINGNKFTFIANGQEFILQLDENSQKIITKQFSGIRPLGEYIGRFSDIGIEYYVYNKAGKLYVRDSDGNHYNGDATLDAEGKPAIITDGTTLIPINNEELAKELFALQSNTTVPDFNTTHVTNHNGVIIITGNSNISGEYMQTYTNDPAIEASKTYTLLAINGDRLGIYENGDISTFRWVENSGKFDATILPKPKRGADEDWTDPVARIREQISIYNQTVLDIWADYTSTEEPEFLDFKNNEYVTYKTVPEIGTVKADIIRNVYRYLKNNLINKNSEIADLKCSWATNNTIHVEYKLDGNDVVGDLSILSGNIHSIDKNFLKSYEEAKATLNDAINEYSSNLEEMETTLSSTALIMSDEVALRQERDNLKAQIGAMERIFNAVENNKDKDPNDLRVLSQEQKAIIIDYIKAVNNKNLSC